MPIIMKIAKISDVVEFALMSSQNALDVYDEFKNLPKTFTISLLSKHNLVVNALALGNDKPFLLRGMRLGCEL